MTELEVARRFGERAGEATRRGDVARMTAERDAFRLWVELIAPAHADLRRELEREFDRAFHAASQD